MQMLGNVRKMVRKFMGDRPELAGDEYTAEVVETVKKNLLTQNEELKRTIEHLQTQLQQAQNEVEALRRQLAPKKAVKKQFGRINCYWD
jgi:predicted RNase H-like nuclease (RuvC/YqgF family)